MTAGSSALGSPVLVGGDEPLSALLAGRLEAKLVTGPVRPEDLDGAGAVVFLPGDRGAAVRSGAPDPDDAEAVQAKDSEIEMIFRDMEQSLINRIVRRLSSPDVTSAYHFMSSQPEASSMEEMELLPTRPQAPL